MPFEVESNSEDHMTNVGTHIEACVQNIYAQCLYKDTDTPEPMTEVMDVVGAGKSFSTERLALHKEEILDLLYSLPLQCRKSQGTGLLLSHAGTDRHGIPWTTDPDNMIMLFVLGAAIGDLTFYLPLGKTSVSECSLDDIIILLNDKT